MTKNAKGKSVAQAGPRKRAGLKRSTIVFPTALHKRIAAAARAERRAVSPMVVVLVERALQQLESAPA